MRTLYRASLVRTLDHPAVGEWVLIDDCHVERVGGGDAPRADRVVDLPGATIVPGFVDAHVHLTLTGIRQTRPGVSDVGSAAGLLQVARGVEPGVAGIVYLQGYDESKWADRMLPTLAALDEVVSRPLVVVRADTHVALANSAALQQSGAVDLPGVERTPSGEPTGVAAAQAGGRLQQWFVDSLSEHELEEFQLQAASLAAARGVTCVHEMALPDSHGVRDFEVLLAHAASLPVDLVPYVAMTDIGYVMDRGLSQIGGDLLLDGSLGARTAHLSEPYEGCTTRGLAYQEDAALFRFLHDAHLAGLQVAMHAIGDAAIEQAVSVWERVYLSLDSRERRHFRARRHRLEHFEMPSADHTERAAMLGLAVSIQPSFDREWGGEGGLYELRLGEARASRMNPFRTLVERGIELGAGSDSPITDLDPMLGIQALESHHDASQRFSREEAIRIFTLGSAKLAHQEGKKGRIRPGAHADFAVYDADPMSASEAVRPVLTVSLGREVFAR